ncbi:E2/UBC family protein [Streptomyces sp. NPDC004680]|uniref:E2/UBC family protein n=1 Tax=Streptomyces sp. NPDC004680 TaxID=3154287 RepID=UPI0033ACACC0
MDLPAEDHAFLRREGYDYDVFHESGMLCVHLKNVALPPGLNTATADILLRLEPLYPDAPPDMWWTAPAITTFHGAAIPATDIHETHRGQGWQRWSRHLPPQTWLSGIDSLESYLTLIHTELRIAAGVAA